MDCQFRVGQKVSCIKKEAWKLVDGRSVLANRSDPKHKEICTIEEIAAHKEAVYLRLKECGDGLYDHKFFRPLQTFKNDISIFQEMLVNQDEPVT